MEETFLVDVPTEDNETAPVDAVVTSPEDNGNNSDNSPANNPQQIEESGEFNDTESVPDNDEGRESEFTDDEIADNTEQAIEEAQSVADYLADKGIDYNAMVQEFAQNGSLSEATYKALEEKAGLPRVLVDSYCEGQQARYDLWANHVVSMVGGEDNYKELIQFASETYSNGEKEAFDRAINSGDPQAARMVLDALIYRYNEANPSYDDGYEYEGQTSQMPDIEGYNTPEEMYEAMEDPRMYTDPDFRAVHDARLMRTKFLNNNNQY